MVEFDRCELVLPIRLCSKNLSVECVGPHFFRYLFCAQKLIPFDKTECKETGTENNSITLLDNISYLKSLEPKYWKYQDHYAVLGLKELRFKATEEQIKSAYRNMVMKYHPDKQCEAFPLSNDYFSCITKAWEILGVKHKRRAYDSVDPFSCDDTIPNANPSSKANFFHVFGKVFDMNARWSVKSPVPTLGEINDSRDHVNEFYSFWYNFESWREYSYLDEDNTEAGQDKESRRWIDKQNKAMRIKKKKDEMTRLRSLVDIAYSLDPRVAKFKNEDKTMKLAAKIAKQEAIRTRLENERKLIKEAEERKLSARAEAEAEERVRAMALKAEREAHKKGLRKVRKSLREFCKANNYYTRSEEETIAHMSSVEKMCELFGETELLDLTNKLHAGGRNAFVEAIGELERQMEEKRRESMGSNVENESSHLHKASSASKANSASQWPQDHIKILVKAVQIFPAGTCHRWDAVTDFLNQHCTIGNAENAARTPRAVLAKVKELQSVNYSRHEVVEPVNKGMKKPFEQAADDVGDTHTSANHLVRTEPWGAEEQLLLEEALKTYPASTPERWDKIATCLPKRSKKACMKRYKELVGLVKAKKGDAHC